MLNCLVLGNIYSTLAGALAAVKLHVPLAHVETGQRSYNRQMPEEHNRMLTEHCTDMLFCPIETAVENLKKEGMTRGVHWLGDTMYDAVTQFSEIARQRSTILNDLNLEPKGYLLATFHRPYNTDNPENLRNILSAFIEIDEPIIFPVHPRTQIKIDELELQPLNPNSQFATSKLHILPPVGYLDMLVLEQNARLILTDSGGMQKEAYFFEVPCITLRPKTEWVETFELGWNALVSADRQNILQSVQNNSLPITRKPPHIFGDGKASLHIVKYLEQFP